MLASFFARRCVPLAVFRPLLRLSLLTVAVESCLSKYSLVKNKAKFRLQYYKLMSGERVARVTAVACIHVRRSTQSEADTIPIVHTDAIAARASLLLSLSLSVRLERNENRNVLKKRVVIYINLGQKSALIAIRVSCSQQQRSGLNGITLSTAAWR